MDTSQVLEEALHLPHDARAFVAEKLLESLDIDGEFPISDEWRDEIRRRCLEIDDERVGAISAEQVFAEAYEALC